MSTKLFKDEYIFFRLVEDKNGDYKWQINRLKNNLFNYSNFICLANDSILYLAAEDGTVWKYQFSPNSLEKLYGLQITDKIAGLYLDKAQRLWISTRKDGLYVYNIIEKKIVQNYRHDEANTAGLIANQTTAMMVSDDNILWIGNWGKGVDYCRLADNGFSHHFTKEEAAFKKTNNFIRGMAEGKDGNFYCNTQFAGVVQLDKELNYIKPISTSFNNTLGIDGSKYNLFFGERNLFKYNLFSKSIIKIKQPSSQSYYFFSPLKNGNTLAASVDGIWSIDNINNTITELPGLNEAGRVQSIFAYEDKNGNIYKYSLTYGLQLYNLINGYYKVAYTFPEKFTAKYVYDENDSTAWIGSTNGLYLFNPSQLKIKKHFTVADGLPNNVGYAIAPDTFGRLWLSTNRGISMFTKATDRFKNFSGISGMQGNEYNSHTVVTASDGRIIFGGVNGLTAIHPWEVIPETVTPKIQITAIKADSSINPFQFYEADTNVLHLLAGSNTLEFNFVGIDYNNPEDCQLKYRLSGYDDNWFICKNPGYARFVQLKPGNYTFEIMAANADGVWSKEAKQLQIKINAAWWQQSWFKMLLIFLIVTGILISIRIYIKQKLYRQKVLMEKQQAIIQERERIIADLHDDVGATLSSMYIYGDLAGEVWETKPQHSKDMVSKITTQAKELMNRIGDIVWSLKPFGEDKNTLTGRLKNYSNELLASKSIECEFSIDEAASNSIINPVARKNILFIAKEAMNNIAKYSKASVASVSLHQVNDEVILEIKDNGIGFDKALLKPGNGLKNMEQRCSLLNGQCKIETTPGGGTLITCSFPIAIISHAG
ncbi:MAG: triple tyrosine motif-containing protein [Bacteroidota bacterium]|nr:triple tyrosine motif-containing protein [Bacteroidota bacterium]